MELDNETIDKIAKLARLKLNDSEKEGLTEQLSNILSLAEQMNQVDTENVDPLAHPLDMVQRLRPDRVTEVNTRDALQEPAPHTDSGLYVVPKVIT